MESLKCLCDQAIVEGMCATHKVERQNFARVLLFIAEADARKLHLKEGYSSIDPQNLRLRCKPHNALAAEQSFGAEVIARAVFFRATCRKARQASV